MIINIENNFKKEVTEHKGIVLVDFWAEWCGPCKIFGPIFETISNKVDNIKFCKLNVDNDIENVSKAFGVMSIPTTIAFKDGEEVKRNTGFLDEENLIKFIGDIDV